jgi:hypothetical protein
MDELEKTTSPYLEDPVYTVKNKAKDSEDSIFRTYSLGIATTGLIRYEWHSAIFDMVVPMCHGPSKTYGANLHYFSSIGYHVAEARNLIVQNFLKDNFTEWLFFIDHDTLPHPFTFAYMTQHIREKKYPIVSGLYFSKTFPSQPLVFRGTRNGVYTDWQCGDLVNTSAVPMGMTIIHRSILEWCYARSREVMCTDGTVVKEVFRTPRDRIVDPQSNSYFTLVGTEDLWFCEKLMDLNVFEETGWGHLKNEKYPFLVDTRIFCKHIDQKGQVWPYEDSYKTFNLKDK